MKIHQKKRIKPQAQTFLFCASLIWLLVSAIATVPTLAFQPAQNPSILERYEDVAMYMDYAYASSASGEEAVSHKEKLLCESDHHIKGVELLSKCNVPIGIARHLKVLKHKGMSHDMYVADV